MVEINELKYRMNFYEKKVYIELTKEMEQYKERLKDYDLDRILAVHDEGYIYGYKILLGYYMIYRERGKIEERFKTKDKNKFIAKWLKNSLSEYGHEFELNNRDELQKEWHYYTKYEYNILKKIKETKVENNNYKYDLEYDPRKYYFDYVIQTVYKANIDETIINYIIDEYTNYMNGNTKEQKWTFDKDKKEFVYTM